MRKAGFGLVAVLLVMGLAQNAYAADAAVKQQLAPTGKLRVAIAVAPAPSAIYVVKDPAGGYRGVSIDLGRMLAEKLKVPVEYVPYNASGEITAAAGSNAWDVTFMPVDDDRRKFVDFGNAFHLLQSTYLVAPGSTIKTIEEANRPGVRIAGIPGTTTFRASNATATKATHIAVKSVDEAAEMMKAGKIDAIGLGRETITGLAALLPGARILDGGFWNSTTAIAVPKSHEAARAYAGDFIEEAKASGAVRKAFDDIGLKTSQVAPAGLKP
jgi:polar amino acid transport system substrate-binding protein